MSESKSLLSWRAKQPKDAIMPRATFDKIEKGAEDKGLSPDRAKRVAGAAYWRTAERKFGRRGR